MSTCFGSCWTVGERVVFGNEWGRFEMGVRRLTRDMRRGFDAAGMYEPPVTRHLCDRVGGATVYDVGARYGYYSLMAAAAGAETIHAFEANEQNVPYLEQNVGESATVHRARVGFDLSLDDVPASPDVVKIDVEGDEWDVLVGSSETVSACALCYVEIHPGMLPESVEPVHIVTLLRVHGFDVRAFDGDHRDVGTPLVDADDVALNEREDVMVVAEKIGP